MNTRALTGQQVHAAYNKVQMEQLASLHVKFTASLIREWQELSQQDRERYARMAHFLNSTLAEMEAHHAD